jgi:hypothetical protein
LPMRTDPFAERQSLTELYKEMSDGELYELNAGITDLTEVAQQVLRDEMRSRRLDATLIESAAVFTTRNSAPQRLDSLGDSTLLNGEDESASEPNEFTWKTLLCECDDAERRWQIQQVLRLAGIESWVEAPGYRVAPDSSNVRILVAADQLDRAVEIAAQPIPQAIIEQSKLPDEEFALPVCPQCGAEDPVLEDVDPVNSWLCEACGKQWSDAPVEDAQQG